MTPVQGTDTRLAELGMSLGDLDRIVQIVKRFAMVNGAPGFDRTPAVIDGCWISSSKC
jgi:hypothetical protein